MFVFDTNVNAVQNLSFIVVLFFKKLIDINMLVNKN